MDKEKQRKEISRQICEHCDHFDGEACMVNLTGECSMAKDSAESILAIGYGNLIAFSERVKGIIREIVEKMWDEYSSNCQVKNCYKYSDIPCGSRICIEENQQLWADKVDQLLKETKS